ncbi:GNAT family N-acetyltransferase [Paracoccus sp. (in: a-proteobacteria)]|uniref:GNAT family N-acetyltransferase n=1 Tax=Paracoccus sp. TaxID=267 RepID=UPI00272D4970|nr:GNAT family N-acetyltransferase [Paracoccus sp. (in: a-proteobacteria)]
MICSCGHHTAADPELGGQTVTLSRPAVSLHGRLICQSASQMLTALDLLPGHVAASRAEPGCLLFRIDQTDDPAIWTLREVFADEAAFAAHRTRSAASRWGQRSRKMGRDFHRHDTHPRIRPESPTDREGLDRLLRLGSGRGARMMERLRADGDLTHSLIAHLEGQPVGHVALSPLAADTPALALGPLMVHPALRGRGLGRALIAAAIEAAGPDPVVAFGPPALFAPCGFRPVEPDPSGQGSAALVHGTLPAGSAIRQAHAFTDP